MPISSSISPNEDYGDGGARWPYECAWSAKISPFDGEETRVLSFTNSTDRIAIHDLTTDELRQLAVVIEGALQGDLEVRGPRSWQVDGDHLGPQTKKLIAEHREQEPKQISEVRG
jgi:hypothetical protein